MEVSVSYDKPQNEEQWNALCKKCGNYLQTTMRVAVDAFYRNRPVYFEVYDDSILVGGVKLSLWYSSKVNVILPSLSKTLSQFGEYILDSHSSYANEIISLINDTITQYIKTEKIVSFSVKGYYPIINVNTELLYKNDKKMPHSKTEFQIAYMKLAKAEEDLYKNMHVKHRNMVNKASRSDLTFEEIPCNADVLNAMLKQTYSQQSKHAPNLQYIERDLKNGIVNSVGKLYVVKKNIEILSCAYVQIYGKVADYSYGGNIKNDLGAGQFLQYNIFKVLKNIGIEYYSLGQIATRYDANNVKFSEGITRFKMRFGCEVRNSSKTVYIFDKKKYALWNFLCKFIS